MNTTVCSGRTTEIYCGFSGADPNNVIPDWRIIRRNTNGGVVSDEVVTGSSIVSYIIDDLRWVPDLNNGINNATYSYLSVGPVDDTHNQSSYQCIFTSDGVRIVSNIATLTVIGKCMVLG